MTEVEQDFCVTSKEMNPVCFLQNPNLGVVTLADIQSENPETVYVNVGFTNMTGYSLEDMKAGPCQGVWGLIKEEDREHLRHTYRTKFDEDTGYRCSYQLLLQDGTAAYVVDNGYFFKDEQGTACAQMILTDVTGMQVTSERVRESRDRLKLGLKSSNSCVFEVDLCRQLFTCFENAAGLFGIGSEKMMEDVRCYSCEESSRYWELVAGYLAHPDDRAAVEHAFEHALDGCTASCEARMKVSGGRFVWCRLNVMPVLDNRMPVRLIGLITNINQIKVRSDKYKRKAARDLPTGLYNKQYAELLVRSTLNNMPSRRHALILIDIDNLKAVNDTCGHDVGDEVIRDVGRQIRQVFRKSDVAGRCGGDEFMVFMKDISGRAIITDRMEEVLGACGGHPVTKSIGISVFPDDGTDYETLFKCADMALYESKKDKNTYTFFH